MLVLDGRITAVFDRLDAKYGDFVFDVARLDFWAVGQGWAEHARAYLAKTGDDASYFDERVRCHQLYTGLDALRFYAEARDEASY